jgi:hypothetical protein
MNKTRFVSLMLTTLILAGSVMADLRTGEAVVAGMVGKAQARVLTGPVHEGKTELKSLNEGDSFGETTRLITGKDGRLCMVLSPGAVLCVAPGTELTLTQLRHTAAGLPASEDDIIRRIHIELHKGRVLVHAGVPTASLDIKIQVESGAVEANGGTFVVGQSGPGQWAIINEDHELTLAPKNGSTSTLSQDTAALMTLSGDQGEVELKDDLLNSPMRTFELCNEFFQDLERFTENPLMFDRQGLSRYLGNEGGIRTLDAGSAFSDVSPTFRPISVANVQPITTGLGGRTGGTRWDNRRIWAWYDSVGVVKGVNYVPRNAVNSTEMWMEKSFDPDLIDEELGWAQDAGYTAVRVQLQYVVWENDPEGFNQRLGKLIEIARESQLRVAPVLFDDLNLAATEPTLGPQPAPVPDKHNARWTPSPGPAMVRNREAWPDLEKYVTSVMGAFKRDDTVLYWDLYNSAGNNDLWEETLPLLDQTFNWARQIDPQQPLAVAAWTKFGSAMSARKLEHSDLITFQSIDSPENVEALILMLQRYDRPIICSGWLMRQAGNDFPSILPIFASNRIGWFNHGLVNGKTQAWIQQEAFRSKKDSELWQQDVFKENGEAYEPKEIELIQGFRFLEGR